MVHESGMPPKDLDTQKVCSTCAYLAFVRHLAVDGSGKFTRWERVTRFETSNTENI